MNGESTTETPYAVQCTGSSNPHGATPCNGGGLIFLTHEEYDRQMDRPDSFWQCPRCGGVAWWSDDNYEKYLQEESEL